MRRQYHRRMGGRRCRSSLRIPQPMEAVGCTGLPAHRCRRRRFPSHVERDWTQPYVASDAVEQAWLAVYRAPETHWELYQLGEELTDLEDAFRLWRFRHVTTVERVIGFKRGTRHQRRGLPAQDARRGAVPGNLEAAHRFVAAPSASQLGAGLLFPSCCRAAIGNRRRKNLWWRAFGTRTGIRRRGAAPSRARLSWCASMVLGAARLPISTAASTSWRPPAAAAALLSWHSLGRTTAVHRKSVAQRALIPFKVGGLRAAAEVQGPHPRRDWSGSARHSRTSRLMRLRPTDVCAPCRS